MGFTKLGGISQLADELSVSQELLRSVELLLLLLLLLLLFVIPGIHQSGYRTCHYIIIGRVQKSLNGKIRIVTVCENKYISNKIRFIQGNVV